MISVLHNAMLTQNSIPLNRIASGGIATFGSLIVKDFGYENFDAILFNIPFGAIQFFVIIGSGWAATHWQRKGLTIAAVSVLPLVGTILMLTVPRNEHNKGVLLFGYYLVSHRYEFCTDFLVFQFCLSVYLLLAERRETNKSAELTRHRSPVSPPLRP